MYIKVTYNYTYYIEQAIEHMNYLWRHSCNGNVKEEIFWNRPRHNDGSRFRTQRIPRWANSFWFPVVLNLDTGATGHEATEETTSTQDRIDTLNLREKELCASVRDLCKAMRDDVLSRVKAEERSYARVLRANQWFVHSLLALVRAEVTKRRELPHFLMEDVAEMLHLSRNLFFPHELIN